MQNFVNLLTFTWLAMWTSHAAFQLAYGKRYAVYFVMLTVFLFCGLPLLLDTVFGAPDYAISPGSRVASEDPTTALIYCGFIAFVPIVLYAVGRPRKSYSGPVLAERFGKRLLEQTAHSPVLTPILYFMLMAPMFLLLLAPQLLDVLHYGAVAQEHGISPEAQRLIPALGPAAIISLTAAAALLVMQPRLKSFRTIFVLFCMMFTDWFMGKRGVVALSIFIIGYVLWHRGFFRRGKAFAFGAIAVAMLAGFSVFYQQYVRGIITNYESYRADFARDDRIKLAIYAELNPETVHILQYRGQSFLFDLVALVPRAYWPDKPYPFSVYLTSAAFRLPDPKPMDWGFTTSWLDESIANLGWIGMLFGPLSLALFCRIGDRYGDPLTRLMTIVIGMLFMAVNVSSFYPLFLCWVLAVSYCVLWYWLRGERHAARRSMPVSLRNSTMRQGICVNPAFRPLGKRIP